MDSELSARVDAYVDEVFDDVLRDIAELVAVPSVADYSRAEPGAPFGPDARRALDAALGIARRLGFETGDDEGYLGWGDIAGEDPRQLATIAHVDVVPAGSGWRTDPFELVRREGWVLGRGVSDDKGPAVLSLYAGAFFKHEGITPRYRLRAMLGSDEEVGMRDVHHYLEGHEAPAFLFTPDASFPVCNAEKGLLSERLLSAPVEDGRILSWSGAEVSNAIPGESVCELACSAADLSAPAGDGRIAVEEIAPGRVRVTAHGIGGHASMPAGTLNAVGLLAGYLHENEGLLAPAERAFVDMLLVVHADTDGTALGIASENEAFGPLTVIGSMVGCADGRLSHTLDMRFPSSTDADSLHAALSDVAARFGGTSESLMSKEPFWVDASHPAVQTLLDVFCEVTGEDAQLFSMGGGTYARCFPCAVSFGPEEPDAPTPDWVGPMHGANEGASEASLRRALKIYTLALLRLQEVEL